MITSDDSEKRERNIKTKRLPNNLHTRLNRFSKSRHYETLWGAMLYLTDYALKIHEKRKKAAHTNAQNRARGDQQ